ncbi:bifunctional DNA-formamidopyrimidine glycosylase/DNA-(apurinic or apyrimidinic site) lyase [Rathayibacter sp. YIM 133350]|uniref:bifunctional DNA-formamidopyrimidine glycosylase/DNA-(apurinic or apyrimidinic site) lyase n=1 Tax=Rathayibacter sp. YIM 133350 TaxID=3131992 RepID=UPI00307F2C00
MPELPEVEVVRAGLEPAVTGALIAGVEVFEPRSLRRHVQARGGFVELLEGRRLLAAVRRGKFLWVPLDSGDALVAHLGMSGQVLLREPGRQESGLLRIRLHLEHPDLGEFWLHFVDQRIFGSMAIDAMMPTSDGFAAGFSGRAKGPWQSLIPAQVAHIARDPLDPAFDDAAFLRALRRTRSGVKRALLNQRLVSGIGNIYADEALWAAKIHYEQPGDSLTLPRARTLLAEVRHVLAKALAEGGTSFDAQYVNVNGASGYFSHSLNVYGRQGLPCPRCGTTIVREQFMNRGSHLCPPCQRLRRPRTPAQTPATSRLHAPS